MPIKFVVVWHEVTDASKENNIFNLSERFDCKDKAIEWLEAAVAEDVDHGLMNDNKVTVTWLPDANVTAIVSDRFGSEKTYQIVELTNGDE